MKKLLGILVLGLLLTSCGPRVKVTKFLKDKQFDMPGPDLSSFSIPKNNKEIVPSIKDADASFIKDAIKIAFTFDFK